MTLSIETIPVTALQQNCRVLINKDSSEIVLIDPGGDADMLLKLIQDKSLKLSAVWLTHSHLDHCGGVADILERYPDTPLLGHPIEKEYRSRVEEISMMYGLPPGMMKNCPEPTQFIEGGENLSFAGKNFEVRFCPGHSPGHVIFYCGEESLLLGGDTLFAGSIGRTDLPGGNHDLLLSKIQSEIYTLPDDTKVLSGHGPDTIVGDEKSSNPYVRSID